MYFWRTELIDDNTIINFYNLELEIIYTKDNFIVDDNKILNYTNALIIFRKEFGNQKQLNIVPLFNEKI